MNDPFVLAISLIYGFCAVMGAGALAFVWKTSRRSR